MNTQSFWNQKIGRKELTWGPLKFARILAPVVNKKRVLDIGCGGGALTKFLADCGAIVTGLDFSEKMIECARENFPDLVFIQGDILTANLMKFNEKFDIICGIAILHEIDAKDTDNLHEFFYKHLKPNGFGYFYENNFFNPFFRFVRKYLVGKYGIPKVGSESETPFDEKRFDMYKAAFKYCERRIDVFTLFELINNYLLRIKKQSIRNIFTAMDMSISDNDLLRNAFGEFSYLQSIYFSNMMSCQMALNNLFGVVKE